MLKILFVHPLVGNAYELFKAFSRNQGVSIEALLSEIDKSFGVYDKIMHKLKLPTDKYNVNKKLLAKDLAGFDVLFVVKSNELKPSTLNEIKSKYPQLKLINWSLDDMYAWHNRSLYYTWSLKLYDLVFTTKSYNVDELPLLGAKKVVYLTQAYSKDIHFPQRSCRKFEHDVVFIGYPEKARIESILYLAEHGIHVDIYGYPQAWKKSTFIIEHQNISVHDEFLEGKNYAEALSCAKISLCFLRKANRDLHTSRSIEIPACGGFMIAERTKDHLELFTENKEAVYFDNNVELLEKVKYFFANDKERKKITHKGYTRCLSSGYSYDDMVSKILQEVVNNEG